MTVNTLRPYYPSTYGAKLRRLVAAMMPASSIGSEPHWACPDCGAPCCCQGGMRYLAHRPCGKYEL